jgi:hypothetical protein
VSKPEVVLYGASGYTGKHVAWKLAERGIPFIAAGRSKHRIEQELAAMPELKAAHYEVVSVDHDEASLTELFRRRKVVHNLVGPFMQFGEPVIRAALAAGVHYLDATGEQDWMLHVRDRYGRQFAERDLTLSPACASMWNSGLLAAEAVLQKEGVDSLDILYTLHGIPSVSSTLSFMRMCCQPQLYLSNRNLLPWPAATGIHVCVPGMHQVLTALPWSGGGESVFFENDARVRNCTTLVAFRNQALMALLIPKMSEFQAKYAHLGREAQEEATNAWAMEIAPRGAMAREDYTQHRVLFTCHGRGTLVARSVAIWGVTGYVMTGTIGAVTIDALLLGRGRANGFQPATRVIGPQRLHSELISDGVFGQTSVLI